MTPVLGERGDSRLLGDRCQDQGQSQFETAVFSVTCCQLQNGQSFLTGAMWTTAILVPPAPKEVRAGHLQSQAIWSSIPIFHTNIFIFYVTHYLLRSQVDPYCKTRRKCKFLRSLSSFPQFKNICYFLIENGTCLSSHFFNGCWVLLWTSLLFLP